jgi:methionyl aminopeptidase
LADPVGPSVSQENLDLIACSRECLDEAIRMCKPGTQFQDVGKVIEEIASKRGFSTNKTYVGHGIHECVSRFFLLGSFSSRANTRSLP